MAKRQINVALIGYQFMGKAHSNAYRQVGRFFDLDVEPVMKVLVGRSEQKVKAAAEQFGWQEYATNWEDVIARDDIDLIDIGTPNDTHALISQAALKAGKHVLCEKPLAIKVADARVLRTRETDRPGQRHLPQLPQSARHRVRQETGGRRQTRQDPPLPRHLSAGLDRRSQRAAGLATGQKYRGQRLAWRPERAPDRHGPLCDGSRVHRSVAA